MSISFNKFVPRPGRVNKQGCLPDPSELVCVEVPKVFDQCLIKKCLSYCEGPDTNTTDCELRSNPLEDPKIFLGCRDFKISLKSVEKIPIPRKKDFKKLVICYVISFHADYVDCNAVNRSEFFEINREDVIWNFYCPDSISKMSSSRMHSKELEDCDTSMIKLEMVADALHGEITKCDNNKFLDITLGYYIVVKCQIIVQLLIPAYDYCPIPKEPCQPEPEENICNRFNKSPVPKFYPNQNLEPLFPESNEDEANEDEMNEGDYGENEPME